MLITDIPAGVETHNACSGTKAGVGENVWFDGQEKKRLVEEAIRANADVDSDFEVPYNTATAMVVVKTKAGVAGVGNGVEVDENDTDDDDDGSSKNSLLDWDGFPAHQADQKYDDATDDATDDDDPTPWWAEEVQAEKLQEEKLHWLYSGTDSGTDSDSDVLYDTSFDLSDLAYSLHHGRYRLCNDDDDDDDGGDEDDGNPPKFSW